MEKIIGLDLSPLRKLAKRMKKYRSRNGRWKFVPDRVLERTLKEYAEYLVSVVSEHLPFDREKHQIDVTNFYVSKDVENLIAEILPGSYYLAYAPALDETLPPSSCKLTDKTLRERDSGE